MRAMTDTTPAIPLADTATVASIRIVGTRR
jgi:hypothetical protein